MNTPPNRPCPECGGTDRFYFIAAPQNEGNPYWRCRHCDHTEPARDEDGEWDGFAPDGMTPAAQRTINPMHTAAAHYAYTTVAERCAAALWRPEGARALAYLRGRGLADTMIRGAKLGWCGDGAGILRELWYEGARSHGMLAPYAADNPYDGARLGGLSKPQARPCPVLQGTITFPYWRGETCVLLRGRKLAPKPGEPKYLSPNGPAYGGGAPSFYLHHVLEATPSVILTEGEIKALVAHQEWRAGRSPLPCIATPGALYFPLALVDALVGKTMYLAYDNDKPKRGERDGAGEKAVQQNGNKLRKAGIAVKVIELPRAATMDKVDLDSYILAARETEYAA